MLTFVAPNLFIIPDDGLSFSIPNNPPRLLVSYLGSGTSMLITGSNFLDAFTCKSVPGTFTFGMFGNLLLGGGVASIILEFSIPNKEPIPDLSLDLFLGSSFLSFDFLPFKKSNVSSSGVSRFNIFSTSLLSIAYLDLLLDLLLAFFFLAPPSCSACTSSSDDSTLSFFSCLF